MVRNIKEHTPNAEDVVEQLYINKRNSVLLVVSLVLKWEDMMAGPIKSELGKDRALEEWDIWKNYQGLLKIISEKAPLLKNKLLKNESDFYYYYLKNILFIYKNKIFANYYI